MEPDRGMGVMMFGPTLLEYGTEAQKLEHIPNIAKGLVRWCQGYSEPGAGSDLASLQMSAEDRGDHYLVNGQKTWTSGGQWADKCFALVRTDKTRKHEGISFLLIDMDAPGVEVKPIRMISGASPFCETFFTNVKVPKGNLVGVEGQGLDDRQAAAPARTLQPVGRRRQRGADDGGQDRQCAREGISRHRRRGPDRGC